MLQRRRNKRRGVIALEAALVYPAFFILLFGIIILGMGVFRYEQVACQAREVARVASVRGAKWAAETKQTAKTEAQLKAEVAVPLAVGMDASLLEVKVHWVDEATGIVHPWDTAAKTATSKTATGETVTNRVRVSVTYQWAPSFFGWGAQTLQSVSEMPMAY